METAAGCSTSCTKKLGEIFMLLENTDQLLYQGTGRGSVRIIQSQS